MTITSDTLGKKGKKNNIIALFFVVIGLLFLGFFLYKVLSKESQPEIIKKEESFFTVSQKEFNFNESSKSATELSESDLAERDFSEGNNGLIGDNNLFTPSKATKISRSGSGGTLVINKENNSHQIRNETPNSLPFIDAEKNDMFSSESQNFKATSAFKSDYDENLLLEQGTYIPCVLRQKLISNVGGQISCTISSNVLSKSGNVVLLEKGTMINGLYKSAGVKRGSNQIFVIWQQARTANNLIVNLNSGSTDELGANGINGWVDQHFWERFGNAIVVSMISDTSSAVSTQLQKSGTQNYLQNTQNESANIAQTIIEKMGDIEPTLYKNQGDKVGVFVARDIDFSSVYSLRLKYDR